MLSYSEVALVAHGRARLLPRVPAQLHHFLCLSPPCVRDFSADTWLYLHFQLLYTSASLGLDVSTSLLNAGNSHSFISLLRSVLNSLIS